MENAMSDDQHDDAILQPAQLQALRALKRDEDPGRLLEERTVQALRAHGWPGMTAARGAGMTARGAAMLRPRSWAWAAAAAVAFFVVGFALGRGTRDNTAHSESFVRPAQQLAVDANRRLADDVHTVGTDSSATAGAQFVVWF
jgi:hypothetical protein